MSNLTRQTFVVFTTALLLAPLAVLNAADAPQASKPNIVYILCDDLGYGDVHCLNPQRGKIATPHIDRLAGQGMIFTDAHSSSAVCTPGTESSLGLTARSRKSVTLFVGSVSL